MKGLTGVLNAALAVALTLYVNPANAQAVKNGGPTGTVVSASVPAPPGSTPIVSATPPTGCTSSGVACTIAGVLTKR
jgi:hypothetical protein